MPCCFLCTKKEGHDVFYPPDMIDEPIKSGELQGKRICHFCKYGTDVLIGTDGTKYEKQAVIADYRQFCEETYKNPIIYSEFAKSITNTLVKRNMAPSVKTNGNN